MANQGKALSGMEERLRREQAESSPLMAWICDSIMLCTYVNKRWLEFTGCSLEEQVGHGWIENVHPDDKQRLLTVFNTALAERREFEMEYRLKTADGNYKWVLVKGIPSYDSASRFNGYIGTCIDVTQTKKLETQMAVAQKMEAISRIVDGVAHDFNNLITIISGYADLVKTVPNLPARVLEDTDEITKACTKAVALTRHLLSFSRPQTSSPRIIDLNVTLNESAKMLKRIIREDCEMEIQTSLPIPRTLADPADIDSILINLVVNARDAMPKGGMISLRVGITQLDEFYVSSLGKAEPGAYVILSVSDTGTGMDAVTQARIFEPFFTTKGQEGNGIGLFTVYQILKKYGGHISVYSEVGKGTSMNVLLPYAIGERETPEERIDSAKEITGNETILLVEDDPGVLQYIKITLERAGFLVLQAQNSASALDMLALHEGPVHMLLTDIVMPGMNGNDLASKVKSERPDIHVLFMSGYSDSNTGLARTDLEKNFLTKPFRTQRELLEKVRHTLDENSNT